MSWPPYKAAGDLRGLPPLVKLTALALGNYADTNGAVRLSNRVISGWSGQAESTVRRCLRELERRELLAVVDAGGGLVAPSYRLLFPGISVTPGVSVTPDVDALTGVKRLENPVSQRHLNDRSLIPSNKSSKASRRRELPTNAQIKKLAFVVIDDPHTQLGEDGELLEYVKRACSQAGFEYHPQQVTAAINQALVTRGRPPLYRELKGQRR